MGFSRKNSIPPGYSIFSTGGLKILADIQGGQKKFARGADDSKRDILNRGGFQFFMEKPN